MFRPLIAMAGTVASLVFLPPLTEAQTAWLEEPVPAEGLKVGNELLKWGEERGLHVLTYDGRVIARSYYGSRTYPPFVILDRWDSPETSAVLLQADAIATRDCASFYVIETRGAASIVAHALGQACVGFLGQAIDRNQEGFVAVESARPTGAGKVQQWRARTGDVVTN